MVAVGFDGESGECVRMADACVSDEMGSRHACAGAGVFVRINVP